MFRFRYFKNIAYQSNFRYSTTSDAPILFEYNKNVCSVTFNRPKALNSMNLQMNRPLAEEVKKWNQDPNIKVVMFDGNGAAFCAGADIKEVYHAKNRPKAEILDVFCRKLYLLDYNVATMKPIQVAFWNGIVMGGGVGISVHAPIRIATEKCVFAMPEVKIGFFTNVGGGHFLSRLQNNLGYYLALTGFQLKGQEVVQTGLADFFVNSEKIPDLKKEIIHNTNLNTQAKDLEQIVGKYAEPVKGSYHNEEFIKEAFGKSSLEDIYNNLKQNTTNKELADEIIKAFDSYSPATMKVIFDHLKVAKNLDLMENFQLEVRLSERFIDTDFFEGIRCMLVDRNQKPKWVHQSLQDVSKEEVSRYFEKLPGDLENLY